MLSWKYKISLERENTGAAAEITQPLSIEFDIRRTTQTEPSTAEFTIYNLAESTRKAFEKMKPIGYAEESESSEYVNYGMDDYCSCVFTVQREGGAECVIFKGDVVECGSERGGGEWITRLNCGDGFFALMYASVSGKYDKNAFRPSVFEMEAKKWKLATELNAEPAKNPVPITLDEKFAETLDWAFPNNWYIDCGTLVAGKQKKPQVWKVDSHLLAATPKREEKILRIQTMFMPEPRLGNIMEVESDVLGGLGQWEIAGISHKGEFPAGDIETEFTLIQPGARYEQ